MRKGKYCTISPHDIHNILKQALKTLISGGFGHWKHYSFASNGK